jgi:glycosyltransferase involved in cell wall biosynthesis
MWSGKRVSVILPTYNEAASIAGCIEEFFALPYVDDVLVVDNNAVPWTMGEIARTNARVVHEPRQGYGWAVRRGMEKIDADLVVICEPDGTFIPGDLEKLLAYTEDFDIVYGSRTLSLMIWQRANMGWFLRLGNIVVAKMIEVLFNCPSLSDVGCTFRVLKKEVSDFLLPHYRISGSDFGPEMMLRSVLSSCRVVQIPVNYRRRVGVSSVTGNPWKAFVLGMRMIFMVLSFRLGSILGMRRYVMPQYRLSRAPDFMEPKSAR